VAADEIARAGQDAVGVHQRAVEVDEEPARLGKGRSGGLQAVDVGIAAHDFRADVTL
jgi:hypothetical protein